jgi:hypothetical protein
MPAAKLKESACTYIQLKWGLAATYLVFTGELLAGIQYACKYVHAQSGAAYSFILVV